MIRMASNQFPARSPGVLLMLDARCEAPSHRDLVSLTPLRTMPAARAAITHGASFLHEALAPA
jgi:hypothetical protein